MPPAASDGRITAACAVMPQQQRSAPTPSAALSADLSSARRGGEPTSQCASPATVAATTAMPPAASDGRITAACAFMPQQHRSAPTPSAALSADLSSARRGGEASQHRSVRRPPRSLPPRRCPQRHRMAGSQLRVQSCLSNNAVPRHRRLR